MSFVSLMTHGITTEGRDNPQGGMLANVTIQRSAEGTTMRKTIAVNDVIDVANRMLVAENKSDDFRLGVIALLNSIQHATDNYNGFNYDRWLNGGCSQWKADGSPEDRTPYIGNETKRFYFRMR